MPDIRRITMRKIKDVLRLKLDAQLSHERIAAPLGISKGVVAKYVSLAAVAGLDWGRFGLWMSAPCNTGWSERPNAPVVSWRATTGSLDAYPDWRSPHWPWRSQQWTPQDGGRTRRPAP